EQSESVPVCSTELLLKPSRPTQNDEYWAEEDGQVAVGWVQLAETLRKAPLAPVTAYPDQFVLCTVAFRAPAAPGRAAVPGRAMRPPGLTAGKAAAAAPGAATAAEAPPAARQVPVTRAIVARVMHQRRNIWGSLAFRARGVTNSPCFRILAALGGLRQRTRQVCVN